MNLHDKRGVKIELYQTVDVDGPTGAWECHQHEFRGVVTHISNLHVTVEDQDGDAYDLPPEHVEVVMIDDCDGNYDVCPDCGSTLRTAVYDNNTGIEETRCTECDYIKPNLYEKE